ncbi:hypothetical protein HYPGJ_31200 [Hyphomicrobium sp. GJ21]|nr:hypothetical protein HYPGJ_31200 [Hyphomicrobium sp. GJ21]
MTRNSIAELALACVATHPSVGERALADVLSQLNSSLHRETHERLVNENECSKKKRLPVRIEVQAVARQRCRSIREIISTLRNTLGLAVLC